MPSAAGNASTIDKSAGQSKPATRRRQTTRARCSCRSPKDQRSGRSANRALPTASRRSSAVRSFRSEEHQKYLRAAAPAAFSQSIPFSSNQTRGIRFPPDPIDSTANLFLFRRAGDQHRPPLGNVLSCRLLFDRWHNVDLFSQRRRASRAQLRCQY